MDALTPGGRAVLELDLQEAKRALQIALDEKNGYTHQADVFSALAAEGSSLRRTAEAIRNRLRAAGMGAEIADLRANVARLEGLLNGSSAQVAPVVLSAEQCAAVDETIGALA